MVVEQTVHGERALDIDFMTAGEAVEYGLIDKVLARRFERSPRPPARQEP